jgi:hypothetical protein
MYKSIYVALCKSNLFWDYSIKMQVPEKFEEDIPIELQQILWKYLWGERKNIHGFVEPRQGR